MATQMFFRPHSATEDVTSGFHTGTNNTKILGTAVGWTAYPLSTTRGTGVQNTGNKSTVTGPTAGIEVEIGSVTLYEWVSLPIAADVTISGTITVNIWAAESSMNANVAINVLIERLTPTGAIGSQIVKTTNATELGTTRTANNFTATPTSTAMTKGDRIRVRIFGDDSTAANMATGFTFNVAFAAASAGVDGDSYVTFNENITFISSAPAGTTLHLTDVAGPAVGANNEKEMWTSFGDGVNTAVVNAVAGWTAPIQWTDTAGGTAIEWYSKGLTGFTLSGPVLVNVWAHHGGSGAGLRAELAVCNNDGSGATTWAGTCIIDSDAIGSQGSGTSAEGALTASTAQVRGYLLAPDVAVTNGQRLRLRMFIDDAADQAMAASSTVTLRYDHTTTGSGDSFITLGQSVTEYAPAAAPPPRRKPLRLTYR
jgi:hypothetical protein